MPIKKVLGYINAFVEHDESKVILIAHEQEILESSEKDAYARTKEKLIGKTFSIAAGLPSAFEEFLSAVEDPDIKQFYTVKKAEIENLFDQSETENLRILRQTMVDFERLAAAMDVKHRRNFDALSDVFAPYFALSFEMKANRIEAKDVTKFGAPDFRRALSGGKDTPRSKVEDRYPEVKFENSIVGMKVIRDAMFDSAIDATVIRDLMDRSKYFTATKDEPAWRALWFSMTRMPDEAQKAVDTVEHQFQQRTFTDQGELLQVFGLRLWTSRIGAIKQSVDDVVRESKTYIDELYKTKRLDPTKSMVDVLGHTIESYQGLGFMERETKGFAELASYLREMELKATQDTYPAKVQGLLVEMERDSDLFARRLCITNSAA